LRRAIKQAYALDQLPSQDEVLELSQAMATVPQSGDGLSVSLGF
jgi:hypothetical protein